MTGFSRGAAAAVVLGLCVECGLAAGQPASDVPALPSLDLSTFPDAARAEIEATSRAALEAPHRADLVGSLAMTLHAWEQFEAAHQAYRRAQALEPLNARWWYLDGVVLQRLVRTPEAVESFRRALEHAPEYLPTLSRFAETTLEAGDPETSASLYARLAAYPAAAPVAAFGQGRLAAARGRHEEAVQHFERAIALFPEFGSAHYGLAMSLRALGRRDEAVAALRQHRLFGARWPGIEDPLLAGVTTLRDDARVRVTRAMRLADEGDVAGAIAAHEEALALDSSLAQAHANLLTLYGRQGDWAKAEAHYRAVIALGFNRDEAHYNYGVLLGQQERWPEAAAAYRETLAVNPRHARAHNNLAQVLERGRHLDAAAEHYRLAIESQPTFRLARFNLGRMLLAGGRFDEAARELEQALEPRDAETPRYLFALAVAHAQAGRRDRGVALASEAHRLALEHGQGDLAAAIERDLAKLTSQ